MRVLARLGDLRIVLATLAGITTVQMVLVALGNLTDFTTNQEFVRHVFAMDTTFRSPNTMWRAITSPGIVNAAYVLVIAWEVLTAAVLVIACVTWIRTALGRAEPDRARRVTVCGWLMELVLFGVGFVVVGGEWFLMWQSEQWNGLDSAMKYLFLVSVGLILAHLPAWDDIKNDRRQPSER